jgi:hypothetical protein
LQRTFILNLSLQVKKKKQLVLQIKNIFSFLLFTLFSQIGYNQVIHEDPAEEVKVFSPDQSSNETDTILSLKRVVHFGWLHPLRGRYPFFYEQAFGGFFGGSVGLGITHADFFRDEHTDIVFNPGNGKMKIGFHGEALTKVYFSGLAIEDYYIGLNGKFSTFNYQKFELNYTNEIKERHYEALLIAGIQFAETERLLVYDYYIGIGFSNIYTKEQEGVNIGGSFVPIDIELERGINPILRIGLKIGIKVK